VEQIPS